MIKREKLPVIITGASSEVGGFLLEQLAASGKYQIIGTMRRTIRLGEIFPNDVEIIDNCDLLDAIDCVRLVSRAQKLFSGPFGLIHSVGDFWDHVPFEDFSAASAGKMFTSHVDTLYCVLQHLVPLMRTLRGGSVVAFSCNSVRYNYPWMASFTAAKSAVDSLVRSLANEFAVDNIRLNSLQLASLKTNKVHDSKPKGDFEHFIDLHALLPVVEFLLSPASRLVNGSALNLFEYSDKFYHTGYYERVAK